MFVFNIWDMLFFGILKAISTVLPYIGLVLLIAIAIGVLAWGVNYLDNKYWHTKTWPWYKQLLVALLVIPIMLIAGLIIILLFA